MAILKCTMNILTIMILMIYRFLKEFQYTADMVLEMVDIFQTSLLRKLIIELKDKYITIERRKLGNNTSIISDLPCIFIIVILFVLIGL